MNIKLIKLTEHFCFAQATTNTAVEFTDDVSTASDKAENAFDVWCDIHHITSSPIKTEEYKLRPDRLAYIDDVKCVLEIKSLYPNDKEKDALGSFNAEGELSQSNKTIDAAKRFTNILSKSNKQLASYKNDIENIPTILLLIDNRPDIVVPFHVYHSIDVILNGIPCVQYDMDTRTKLVDMVYDSTGLSTVNLTNIKYIAYLTNNIIRMYENPHCNADIPSIPVALPHVWGNIHINKSDTLKQLTYTESEVMKEAKKHSPFLSMFT